MNKSAKYVCANGSWSSTTNRETSQEWTDFWIRWILVRLSQYYMYFLLQRRIKENKERMDTLGLATTVKQTQSLIMADRKKKIKAIGERKRAIVKVAASAPRRRSRRVAGEEAETTTGEQGDRYMSEPQYTEETYSSDHVRSLGRSQEPWELFVDGYDAKGNRIYDKATGLTCHQCRQKTLGKRTSCSQCESLQGVFCGDCLYMRYGENLDEVACNPSWVCPPCRDLCNCSFHRSKRGWCPTGTLYRKSIAEGYASVAHYLVLTQLDGAEAVETAKKLAWWTQDQAH